jgi:polyisoprenoid-binding protein YceI
MNIAPGIKKLFQFLFVLFLLISFFASAKSKSITIVDEEVIPTRKKNSFLGEKNIVQKWNADAANAKINFSVRGPFGTVDGSLSGLNSNLLFDKDQLTASSVRASVDGKSISTGIRLRNKDLQKEKYLYTEKYPLFSFQSDKIERSGNGYKATGGLTIKGVTKKIELPFTFLEKGNSGVFKGGFTIQRQDYGIGNSGGSIGSTITIDLEVPVTK